MSSPAIPTYTGTLPAGTRVAHVQTGHHGTVEDHAAGSYYIRWDAPGCPARWFEGRMIAPANA